MNEVSDGCSARSASKVIAASDCEALVCIIEWLIGACRKKLFMYTYIFKRTS